MSGDWRGVRVIRLLGLGVCCVVGHVAVVQNAAGATGGEGYTHTDCAAYFFATAHAKGITHYDQAYTSGEYLMNLAILAQGRSAASAALDAASAHLYQVIEHDWANVARLDEQYAVLCEDLVLTEQRRRRTAPSLD